MKPRENEWKKKIVKKATHNIIGHTHTANRNIKTLCDYALVKRHTKKPHVQLISQPIDLGAIELWIIKVIQLRALRKTILFATGLLSIGGCSRRKYFTMPSEFEHSARDYLVVFQKIVRKTHKKRSKKKQRVWSWVTKVIQAAHGIEFE